MRANRASLEAVEGHEMHCVRSADLASFKPNEVIGEGNTSSCDETKPDLRLTFNYFVSRERLTTYFVTAGIVVICIMCIVVCWKTMSNKIDCSNFENEIQSLKNSLNKKTPGEEVNLTASDFWNKLEQLNITQQSHQQAIARNTQLIDKLRSPLEDGKTYIITSIADGLVLDVYDSPTNNDTRVISNYLHKGLSQKWRSIKDVDGGWLLFTSIPTAGNKGLDQDVSTGKLRLSTFARAINQMWHIQPATPGADEYLIISAANGEAITSYRAPTNRTLMCQPQNATNILQHWKIEEV